MLALRVSMIMTAGVAVVWFIGYLINKANHP
jgi:hypothetical protein